MTNKQKWVTIILSFILAFSLILGSCLYGSIRSVEHILLAPAATSKIDIDADIWFGMNKYGELEPQVVHLNRIQGELNSKIIDLIILALSYD